MTRRLPDEAQADDTKLWSIPTIEDLRGLVGPKTTVAENNTKRKECARLPTINLTCTTYSPESP